MSVVNAAIVLKAIKLSRYGVIQISDEYYQKAKRFITKFTENRPFGPDELTDKCFFPRVVAEKLVHFINEEIKELDGSALLLIDKLMQKPLWTRIEEFSQMTSSRYESIDQSLLAVGPDNSQKDLIKMAIATDVCTAKDRRNAVRRIAAKLQKTYAETSSILKEQSFVWSPGLARFVMIE